MKRILLFIAGCLSLAVGTIGIFLPVLPTTPLVLLSAVCFSFSSPKAHHFLLTSRIFGPYIENYRSGCGISIAAKAKAIAFLWCGLLLSVLLVQKFWLTILLAFVGVAVTIHLLLLKTKGKEPVPKNGKIENRPPLP